MDGSAILDFFKGRMSRKTLKVLVIAMAAFFFSFIITSASLYPGGYNLLERAISSLGNPLRNPFPGWFFFSLAFWSSAILLIPFVIYIHRRLSKILKGASRISLFFTLTACTGMMLLGFFPESHVIEDLHGVAAAMSFGGYFFSYLFTWIVIGHDIRAGGKEKRRFSPLILTFMIILMLSVIVVVGLSQLLPEIIEFQPKVPWWIDFPFWEWNLLFAISIHAILLALIMPEEIPS